MDVGKADSLSRVDSTTVAELITTFSNIHHLLFLLLYCILVLLSVNVSVLHATSVKGTRE